MTGPRRGTTTYTHVSDQHSPYDPKVIPTTWHEAVAVLDGIFGNATDLPLGEHTVDTAGKTLGTFADLQPWLACSSPRASATSAAYGCTGSIWRSQYSHAGPCSASRSRPN